MCVRVHNNTERCCFQQRREAKKKRPKVMERIRKRQHKRNCIAPIYKPETGALDWVVENKTEREKNTDKRGSRRDKNRRMGEKKMKRWMDTKKRQRREERREKGRREEEYIYLE